MLRIGFIGAGFNAKFHCRALRSVRGAELVGVHALKGAEELAAMAAALGVGQPQVYGSIAGLCANVDVVGMFVPNYVRQFAMSEICNAKLAGAGLKGVICEKPLARNCVEAKAMVGMAEEAKLQTAYFENQIHMPDVTACREQLAKVEKSMGPVALTRGAEEHGGPHEPWFWDPTKQGGGVFCDMGCHSVAVGMHMLTPQGRKPDFLRPVSVIAFMALIKWGRDPWRSALQDRGVDYAKTPAEDYATAVYVFENPETGQRVVAQATDSWMYDAPGLRLSMDALGPGYSYAVNTLNASSGIFIGDVAADAIGNAEMALEKSQASRGALVIQRDEALLYGYVDEWRDALASFEAGHDAYLNFAYGELITKLVMAAYLSAESRKRVNINDPFVDSFVSSYVPLIQQGRGREVLCPASV